MTHPTTHAPSNGWKRRTMRSVLRDSGRQPAFLVAQASVDHHSESHVGHRGHGAAGRGQGG